MALNPSAIPADSIAHPVRAHFVNVVTAADLARSGVAGLVSQNVDAQPQQFDVQITPFDAIPVEKLAAHTPST